MGKLSVMMRWNYLETHWIFKSQREEFEGKSCGVGPRPELWCCLMVWTWFISGDIQRTVLSAHLPVSHNPHISMVKLLLILFVWLKEFESICSKLHTTFSEVQHSTGFPIPVLPFKQPSRPAQSNRTAWNDGDILIHTVQYGGHQPYVGNVHLKCGWGNKGAEFLSLFNFQCKSR